MWRYLAGLLVALFAVTSLDIGLYSQPTTAQDQTEQRLSTLETQVAVLEERVDALESGGNASITTPGPASGGEGGTLVVSGVGSIVTEEFQLDAGRYEVTVDVASGCCIALFIYGPSGSEELLFNEIFPGEGGTVTDIYQVSEPGVYFIDSQNTDSDWTVTFEKR